MFEVCSLLKKLTLSFLPKQISYIGTDRILLTGRGHLAPVGQLTKDDLLVTFQSQDGLDVQARLGPL